MVILTWNEEANIASCLASLAQQVDPAFEAIVIDAASEDGTVAIVRRMAPSLPFPVRLEACARRLPIGEARNLGVALARTPLLAFLSADAEAGPTWTQEARRSLHDADMVFGRQTHAPRRWTLAAAVRGLRYEFPPHVVSRPERYASNVAAAYRIDVLQAMPFEASANGAEDLVLARVGADSGYRVAYNPRMVVSHHDADTLRAELRKNVREGYGWGRAVRHLGVFSRAVAWGAALLLVPLLLFLIAGLPLAMLFFVAVLWAPALLRVRRAGRRLPKAALVGAVAASPFFDVAFLASYVAGWLRRNGNGHQPAPPAASAEPRTRRRTTVLLILDAGRADYPRPSSMPFLSGLAARGSKGSLESPPGFAQRTAMFTGTNPDRTGNFSAFVYDPRASPFQWMRRLGPLARLVRPRRALFPLRLAAAKITRRLTGTYHADPAWIPWTFLPFFRPCEDMRPVYDPGALGRISLFDLCRANGLRYRYLAHPVSGDDDHVHETLVRDLRASRPFDLYVAQLSVLDQQGHTHGPHSDHLRHDLLGDLDAKLASIHAALRTGYDTWDLLIVGDHGMAPVERRVDIQAALRKTGARPGRDYVLFVNSTLALVWYLTPRGRTRIEPVLRRIDGARLVDPEERRQRRIPTEHRWGERMVAAEPGVLFWPDYFHVLDSTIVGMHGYLDKSEEGHGLAVLASSRRRAERALGHRPLVDVFPTLCDLLGVPAPSEQEGTSMVRPLAPTPPAPLPPQLVRP